jgi:RNA-directed DNA polymerase
MVEKHVKSVLSKLPYPKGLVLNVGKTMYLSRRHRWIITGLVLTPTGKVSIGRDRKRALHAAIHQWATLDDRERRRLAGTLAFVKSVEPEFINRLFLKYDAVTVKRAMVPPDGHELDAE